MKTLIIEVCSGISADGINVTILEDGKSIYANSYRYGYNASYNRSWATKKQPYIRDIFVDLAKDYNVDKIEVISGENTFTGKPAYNDSKLQSFIDEYEIEKILC